MNFSPSLLDYNDQQKDFENNFLLLHNVNVINLVFSKTELRQANHCIVRTESGVDIDNLLYFAKTCHLNNLIQQYLAMLYELTWQQWSTPNCIFELETMSCQSLKSNQAFLPTTHLNPQFLRVIPDFNNSNSNFIISKSASQSNGIEKFLKITLTFVPDTGLTSWLIRLEIFPFFQLTLRIHSKLQHLYLH